jgi:streptogramin lyase
MLQKNKNFVRVSQTLLLIVFVFALGKIAQYKVLPNNSQTATVTLSSPSNFMEKYLSSSRSSKVFTNQEKASILTKLKNNYTTTKDTTFSTDILMSTKIGDTGSGPAFNYNPPSLSCQQQTNSTYSYLTQWGTFGSGNSQFSYPVDITVDPSMNIYVTDSLNNRIQKFDSVGNYITQFGVSGFGNGEFNSPQGVSSDSIGNIYVADSSNNRIQKFDSLGNFILKFGFWGSGYGNFNYPSDVTTDSIGNIYVADTANNLIQKFDSVGNYITQWATQLTINGYPASPDQIAVDSIGNMYISSMGDNLIQKFDSVGNYIYSIQGTLSRPFGIVTDSIGNIYVADKYHNRIQKFNPNGNFLVTFGVGVLTNTNTFENCFGTSCYTGRSGSINGEFIHPRGVAIDLLGNVYVVDTKNGRVQKFGCVPGTPPPPPPNTNGSIKGVVYIDTNHNGQQNIAEPLLAGISVGLFDTTSPTPLQITTSDTFGQYTFTVVTPNTYYVALINETGFQVITQPIINIPVILSAHTHVYIVPLAPGGNTYGVNFGVIQKTIILPPNNFIKKIDNKIKPAVDPHSDTNVFLKK